MINTQAKRRFRITIILIATLVAQLPATFMYEQAISEYHRQITILDISCSLTDITKIGIDKGHIVVSFCSNKQKIENLLRLEKKDTLIIFDQAANRNIIEALARCEHFDIVVIDELSYIRLNQTATNRENLRLLGDLIVVQRFEQQNKIYEYLIQGTSRKKLTLRHIFWPHGPRGKTHTVVSTHDSKMFIKTEHEKVLTVAWVAGINLLTFVAFNGIYPYESQLNTEINRLEKITHPDWSPSNMILTGQKIVFIDTIDHWAGRYPSLKTFKRWVQATRVLLKRGPIESKHDLYVNTFC